MMTFVVQRLMSTSSLVKLYLIIVFSGLLSVAFNCSNAEKELAVK